MKDVRQHCRWMTCRQFGMLLVVAASLFLIMSTTGCQKDSGGTVPAGIVTPLGAAENGHSGGFIIPTIADLRAQITLTEEQAAGLNSALQSWDAARTTWRSALRSGDAATASNPAGAPNVSPFQGFLVECSGILNTDQFVALAAYLKEHSQPVSANATSHGPSGRAGGARQHMGVFAKELSLTDIQKEELQKFFQQCRDSSRATSSQGEVGQLDSTAFRKGRAEFRAQIDQEMQKILTPEQYSKLAEMRAKGDSAMPRRQHPGPEAAVGRRLNFLQRTLGLSTSQSSAVQQILASNVKTKPAGRSVRSAGVAPSSRSRGDWQAARTRTDAEIRKLLTADQARRFDALCDLRPGIPGN